MIARLKNLSRGGWITLGIILGAILAPGVAIAAFSDIRIVGVTGSTPAQVTPANQLRVAEIDPARLKAWHGAAYGGGPCQAESVPAGNSALLRQIVLDVYTNSSPSSSDTIYVFAGKICDFSKVLASFTPVSASQTMVIPFDPGVPLANGDGFSIIVGGTGIFVEYTALGYTMPPAAVPATIGVSSKGPSRKQR